MKHSELRHQPRHVNPRIQAIRNNHQKKAPEKTLGSLDFIAYLNNQL